MGRIGYTNEVSGEFSSPLTIDWPVAPVAPTRATLMGVILILIYESDGVAETGMCLLVSSCQVLLRGLYRLPGSDLDNI